MKNSHKNKIILFHASFRSLTGILIANVTDCPYSHAVVYSAGHRKCFHASESRGGFHPVTDEELHRFSERQCTVYHFPGDLFGWVNEMRWKDYDWPGVLFWWLKHKGNPDKVYCFEAAMKALEFADHIEQGRKESPISGCDFADFFESGETGRFLDVLF